MGVAAWAFLASLDAVGAFRDANRIIFLGLPVVGVATAWLYRTYGKGAARGNNLVIDSTLANATVPLRMAPFTFVCSVATHLVGGSAGREGTAVQIGGTIASTVSRLLHLTGRDLFDWAAEAVDRGAGEVLFTSMDNDGTCAGYPCETYARLADSVPVPVIASGGAGTARHIADVLTVGRADAALAASIFHYGTLPLPVLKRQLKSMNINVRI